MLPQTATREWLVRNSGVSMEDLAAKRGDGAPEDDAFSELLARKDLSEDSKVAPLRLSQNRCVNSSEVLERL